MQYFHTEDHTRFTESQVCFSGDRSWSHSTWKVFNFSSKCAVLAFLFLALHLLLYLIRSQNNIELWISLNSSIQTLYPLLIKLICNLGQVWTKWQMFNSGVLSFLFDMHWNTNLFLTYSTLDMAVFLLVTSVNSKPSFGLPHISPPMTTCCIMYMESKGAWIGTQSQFVIVKDHAYFDYTACGSVLRWMFVEAELYMQ